jgi:hypothetical protein
LTGHWKPPLQWTQMTQTQNDGSNLSRNRMAELDEREWNETG